MQFSQDLDINSYTIRAYRPGEIVVSLPSRAEQSGAGPTETESVRGSLVISPEALIRDWEPDTVAMLDLSHLEMLAELSPEVVLIGSGESLCFPDHAILSGFYQRRIGVEIMDTAAACRTYNILMAEGRKVVAGLINPE